MASAISIPDYLSDVFSDILDYLDLNALGRFTSTLRLNFFFFSLGLFPLLF
jgi:hypothetical protein